MNITGWSRGLDVTGAGRGRVACRACAAAPVVGPGRADGEAVGSAAVAVGRPRSGQARDAVRPRKPWGGWVSCGGVDSEWVRANPWWLALPNIGAS
jgi:hypothetical protein